MRLSKIWDKLEHFEYKEYYHEFHSKDEATTWGLKHYKKWGYKYRFFMQKIKDSSLFVKSEIKINPVEYYCGHGYKNINAYKRNFSSDVTLEWRVNAELLSLVLLSAPPIPENIVVYKMVSKEYIEELTKAYNEIEHHYYNEKGFFSTSLTKDIALDEDYKDREILKIYVPKGKYGIFVDSVVSRGEYEILLQNNISIRMCGYPYKDLRLKKTIYECEISPNYYF